MLCPPGNHNISHLGKRKIIIKNCGFWWEYVSSQEGSVLGLVASKMLLISSLIQWLLFRIPLHGWSRCYVFGISIQPIPGLCVCTKPEKSPNKLMVFLCVFLVICFFFWFGNWWLWVLRFFEENEKQLILWGGETVSLNSKLASPENSKKKISGGRGRLLMSYICLYMADMAGCLGAMVPMAIRHLQYMYIYIYMCYIYIYALCQIAVLLGSVYVTFSCLNELASVFGRFNFWATLEKLRTYLSFLYHTQAGRKIHSWNMNHPGSIHPMYRQFIILFANFDLTASFLLVIAGCLYQSSLFLLFFKSTYTLTWM